MTVTGSREAQALVRDWLSAHGAVLEPLMAADLVSRVAALSPDPAGVTLTVEDIAATIRAKFVENWECSELGSAWDEDVLLTGCRKVGNGKGYQNPEEAAQNLATDAATAILSLIQKSVQPSIATMPTTSGTAAPVCETALAKRCYAMTEPHLSGYRMVVGFTSMSDAQDAQQALANLPKGKP